ncbi:MAG TPA: polymer-forming cytoskeletal protein [Spirochaetota bacterium]|nr:polymer-forming cytoskeletal protein [Spirochaetota bacterium]HOM39239.1 polymer-forming cytoskeletal protein [Spirochaetota bacterium]HPQ48646.1 polymer-forming cytoskeletal protein [Spirochaetota bacterium]
MSNDVKLTFFEDDITFKGDIKLSGELVLNGKIDGNIIAPQSKITVNKSGQINGKIEAKSVENFGKIYGELKSDEYIVHNEAENDASVTVNKILVEYGAFFNGNCKMERK